MKPAAIVQVFDALDDLTTATAPFLEMRAVTRNERIRLASAYQQARVVVEGKRAEVEEATGCGESVDGPPGVDGGDGEG